MLCSIQSAYVWPQLEHILKLVKMSFSSHDLHENLFFRACSSYWWWWWCRWNIKTRQNIHQMARVLKSQTYHLPLPVTSQHEGWCSRHKCGSSVTEITEMWRSVFIGFHETVGWWKLYFMQFKYIFPVRMIKEDNEVRIGLMGRINAWLQNSQFD